MIGVSASQLPAQSADRCRFPGDSVCHWLPPSCSDRHLLELGPRSMNGHISPEGLEGCSPADLGGIERHSSPDLLGRVATRNPQLSPQVNGALQRATPYKKCVRVAWRARHRRHPSDGLRPWTRSLQGRESQRPPSRHQAPPASRLRMEGTASYRPRIGLGRERTQLAPRPTEQHGVGQQPGCV